MGTGSIEEDQSPEWLTNTYLDDILRVHLADEQLKVTAFGTTIIATNGEGFASILYRVSVQLDRNGDVDNISLIFKVHPTGMTGDILKKNQLFPREIHVYKEILPRITKHLESINDFTKISPICLHTAVSPEIMLILEDIKANNFDMFERGKLLNLEHGLVVLEKMAKFHACSAVIYEQNPKLMDPFLEGQISANPTKQDFLGFFPANFKSLAEEVAQWNGYEEIAFKLFALEHTIIGKGINAFIDAPDSFRVLNQDDLWINNVMFKYVDHCPEEAIVLDYQLAYFGSPGIDLNYFLFGSINENVRKVHFKFMVREYYRTLKETLQLLKYSGTIPTLKDIHIELIRKSILGVIAAVCLTPIIFMDTSLTGDMRKLFDRSEKGEAFRRSNISNPKYKIYIQKLLKHFELSGFLD